MNMLIQELFRLGMDRELGNVKQQPENSICINLGSGKKKKIPNCIDLDLPEWDAEVDKIPFSDNSVGMIHCYHFLEHFSDPIKILLECQRVLQTRGVLNICVPFYKSSMAHHDLDHKKTFNEETYRNLFSNPYYDKGKNQIWEFKINFNCIIGIVERNLCVLTQLEKL